MSLAAPAWLLLASLGLVVVLLHIRRRRRVEISSVALWLLLQTAARPRRAWEPPRLSLLLLLQLLAVVLLTLALADPLLGARDKGPDHRIFVVDGSGSMQATDVEPSRHAATVEHLVTLLAAWERSEWGRTSLVSATTQPRVAAARYRPRDDIIRAVEQLEVGDGPADWERVAELVSGLLSTDERTQVVVLSDNTGTNPAAVLRERLPDLEFETITFGTAAPNIVLASTHADPLDLETGRWHLQGELRSFPAATGSITVRTLYQAKNEGELHEWASQEVNLEEGRGTFDFDVTVPGAGLLELRLPDDVLDHDNVATFRLLERVRSARVLYLSSDIDTRVVAAEPSSLLRALRSVPHVEVDEAEALPANSESYDLVVLDNVRVPRHPGTHTLWVGVARHDGESTPDVLADPTPSGWPDRHPLAVSVSWAALEVEEAYRLERRPGAAVLVEASGAPLVQARMTEYGHEVLLAFSPSRSSWPQQSSFPAFVANLIRQVVPDLGSALGRDCLVGAPCPLDPRWLTAGARVIGPEGEEFEIPSPFVFPPDNELSGPAWAPPGFEAPFRPLRAGLYEIDTGSGRQPLSVNGLHPAEGDLAPGGMSSGEMTPTGEPFATVPGGHRARQVLLMLALAALLLEGWLAGRGSERYLHRADLASDNLLSGRRRTLLTLRLATLTLLALALADLTVPFPARQAEVVLVTDVGVANPAGREALEQLYASARAQVRARMGGGRELAAVELGFRPRVAASDGEAMAGDTPEPGGDLAGALDLAGGLLPQAGGGRIVLVSSGNETRGDVATVLTSLRDRGIPVDVLPIRSLPENDTFVEDVAVSERLVAGDSFALHGIIRAGRSGDAVVRLLREGKSIMEREVALQAGRNLIETIIAEEEPGTYLYEVTIEMEGDPVAANNRNGTIAEIRESPRLLVLSPEGTTAGSLAGALEFQGLKAEIVIPSRAPWTLAGWLAYDIVALLNVPAIDLHTSQQELLERWVRDHGGGLLLLGGENTFGPGGYYRTPLERVSPLSSRVPREAPNVALLFVLDRSGSMQRLVGEGTRLDVAKEAALDAIELLDEENLIGVVVFDAEATTLVPLQPVGNREVVREALEPLVPGGGTAIYPALVRAFQQMSQSDAMARHIVLMTDGLSQPGDFDGILDRITAEGITVSTVAIGDGADVVRLENMARAAGGAFHETRDFAALPSILSQEALLLSSTPVKERTVEPKRTRADATYLTGLPQHLPPIHGYVVTTPKSEADVHLTIRGEDGTELPLLATWRYGAGRVISFTTHAVGTWSAEWQAMPEYPLLWSQLARSVLRETAGPGISLVLERSGDELVANAEVAGPESRSLTGRDLVGTFIPPGTVEARPFELKEVFPNVYRGSFPTYEPGMYQVRVEVGTETTAAVAHVAYPAGYSTVEPDSDRLQVIATSTGGRILSGGEALFIDDATWDWYRGPSWRLWALLSLALFMLELFIRYAPGLFGLSRPRRRTSTRSSYPTAGTR